MVLEVVSFDQLDQHIGDSDLPYEYQIIEDPNDLTNWMRYYWHKDSLAGKLFVLQRACTQLPRSYKLWSLYLSLRTENLEGLNPVEYQNEFQSVNQAFEKSLYMLNKMPLIWIKYLEFLSLQSDITQVRRKFNQSLRILPYTQHNKIWPLFLKFADDVGGLTGSTIYQRYLTFDPAEVELVKGKLIEFGDIENALLTYDLIIEDESFVSKEGKSPLDLWTEYSELLINFPGSKIDHHLKVEKFIRSGLVKYPDQGGTLYVKLATYFIKQSDYERARDIFEEGLSKILTIKDLTLIYDVFSEFEEGLVTEVVEQIKSFESLDENEPILLRLNNELDFKLERFDKLINRRPFLVSDVKIRQNPNNVEEWLNRVELFPKENLSDILQCYVEAITTIDPKRATEGLSKLWIQYSSVYEKNNDLTTTRTILDKAAKVPFNSPEELVNVWLEWAELELRQDNIEIAIKVLEVATKAPKVSKVEYWDGSIPVQGRIHKSYRLWSFYLDLIESSGDISKTSEVYDRVFELKIATPLTVINYANFLEDNKRFEESFRIYERGIEIFKYPIVFEIWNIYLTKALKRNLSTERIRDLFDHALEGCPNDLSKSIYLLYSKFEEDNGSIQRSLKTLSKAADEVEVKDKPEVFEILIQKSIDNLGLSSTRPIFTKAIEILPASISINFVLKFAEVELQLKEFTRVRSILKHGGLLQSPAKNTKLWEFWHDFEVENGNKNTYKDMLKVKREANEQFSTELNYESLGFVKSSDNPKVSSISIASEVKNPDAIDLDI